MTSPTHKAQPTSWRDVLPVHPAADMFPMMSRDELLALGEDIKKNGMRFPVIVWKEEKHLPPQLLDGRNRLDAMEAVGLTVQVDNDGADLDPHIALLRRSALNDMWWPIETKEVRGDKPGGDPYDYVVSTNVHRRHLTAKQKRELIAKLLKAEPMKSDRHIAETVRASPTTVGAVRARMEATGDVSKLDTRTDSKGRQQPAKRKRRDIDDYLGKKRERMQAKGDVETVTTSVNTEGRQPPAKKPPPRDMTAAADRAEEDAAKARAKTDGAGPDSAGEARRLRARIEELQNEKRLVELENVGLRSEIDEIKAARKPTPAGRGDKHFCSFCGRGQDKVGALVVEHDGCAAICNECVDVCVDVIAKQKAAPPPADDGLGIQAATGVVTTEQS